MAHDIGSWAEWATVLVTLVGAFFVVLQLQLDHERTRLENAARAVLEWADRQKPETSVVRRFVATLSKEQCKQLYNQVPFSVQDTSQNREFLEAVLVPIGLIVPPSNPTKAIELDLSVIRYLRYNSIYYINLTEAILTKWNSGVADSAILFDQFKFIKRKNASLPNLRIAVEEEEGFDTFPNITNFINNMSSRPKHPLQHLGLFYYAQKLLSG